MHSHATTLHLTLAVLSTLLVSAAAQVDLLNFATKDFIPPSLKSLQLSSLTTGDKPIINAQPWHPSTSCQPLLDAISTVSTGSALRLITAPDGPTFTTLSSPLYALGSTSGTPARRILVSASNTFILGERMRVLVHWHGTTGTTITRQELDNMSPAYAALSNTLVLAPTSAIGPSNREWHLTNGSDSMADVWLMDDLITCLSQSDRIDTSKVSIVGMSAGGVHVSYLAMLRPHYLAAAVSFSGGIPRLPIPAQAASVPNASVASDHPYARLMPRLTPVLALAGGPTDVVTVRFPTTTDRFHRLIWTQHAVLAMTAPGVKKPTFVRCDHTQGHRPWMGPEAMAPFLMADARKFGFTEDAEPMVGMAPGEAGTCRVIGDAAAAGVNVDEVKAVVEQMAKSQGVGVGEMAGKESAGLATGAEGGAKSRAAVDSQRRISVVLGVTSLAALGGLL